MDAIIMSNADPFVSSGAGRRFLVLVNIVVEYIVSVHDCGQGTPIG